MKTFFIFILHTTATKLALYCIKPGVLSGTGWRKGGCHGIRQGKVGSKKTQQVLIGQALYCDKTISSHVVSAEIYPSDHRRKGTRNASL